MIKLEQINEFGNVKRRRVVKTGKEKFEDTYKKCMVGKITITEAANKLNITEDVFNEYLTDRWQLKVSKGELYGVLEDYKEYKITKEEVAVKLSISVPTFYNYYRRFGRTKRCRYKYTFEEIKPYIIEFKLGKIKAEEIANKLGIHVETFRWYTKIYKDKII